MNYTFVLIGFALAVFMGAGIVSLVTMLRPQWSALRQQLTAASVLPAITAVATGLGVLFISTADHGQSETMEDLAIAALATFGAGAVLLAFVGGLIGATLAGRRRGR
jgi:hypothetical protein